MLLWPDCGRGHITVFREAGEPRSEFHGLTDSPDLRCSLANRELYFLFSNDCQCLKSGRPHINTRAFLEKVGELAERGETHWLMPALGLAYLGLVPIAELGADSSEYSVFKPVPRARRSFLWS